MASKADEDLAVGKANRRVLKESIQVTEGIGEEISQIVRLEDLMGIQWIGLENHCKIIQFIVGIMHTYLHHPGIYLYIYIYMNMFI